MFSSGSKHGLCMSYLLSVSVRYSAGSFTVKMICFSMIWAQILCMSFLFSVNYVLTGTHHLEGKLYIYGGSFIHVCLLQEFRQLFQTFFAFWFPFFCIYTDILIFLSLVCFVTIFNQVVVEVRPVLQGMLGRLVC